MREASKDCIMYPKNVIQAFRAERFKLSRFENKAQNREHTLPTSHDKLSRFMFVSAFIGGGINNHPCLKLQQHIVLNLTYYYLGLLGWRPKNSQQFFLRFEGQNSAHPFSVGKIMCHVFYSHYATPDAPYGSFSQFNTFFIFSMFLCVSVSYIYRPSPSKAISTSALNTTICI